jgi:hypothetical protein
MTRVKYQSPSVATRFAYQQALASAKLTKEAAKGLLKLATTPVQKVANVAGKALPKIKGVKK